MRHTKQRRIVAAAMVAGGCLLAAVPLHAQSRTYGAQDGLTSLPVPGGHDRGRRGQDARDVLRLQLQNNLRRQQIDRQNDRNRATSRSQPIQPRSPRSSVVVNQE